MLSRHSFEISTDTGTYGDTGPVLFGEVRRMAWRPSTPDTGADLRVMLMPVGSDTGAGFALYDRADVLGAAFNVAPVIPGVGPDGLDTGVDEYFCPVAAAEKLRIKVTPGGAAVAGTLWVWAKG
jgi:hypothetical protein